MSKAIITEQHLHDIADAIIAKGGATAPMTPAQMPAAIAAIPSGGGEEYDWDKRRAELGWPDIEAILAADTHDYPGKQIELITDAADSTILKGGVAYLTSEGDFIESTSNYTKTWDRSKDITVSDETYKVRWILSFRNTTEFNDAVVNSSGDVGSMLAYQILWYANSESTVRNTEMTTWKGFTGFRFIRRINARINVRGNFACNNCTNLEIIDGSLTFAGDNLSRMFQSCFSLREILATVAFGVAVTDTSSMFASCYALTHLPDGFATPKTTNTSSMFNWCYSLTHLPDGFATPETTNTSNMFQGCLAKSKIVCDWQHVTSVGAFRDSNIRISELRVPLVTGELSLGYLYLYWPEVLDAPNATSMSSNNPTKSDILPKYANITCSWSIPCGFLVEKYKSNFAKFGTDGNLTEDCMVSSLPAVSGETLTLTSASTFKSWFTETEQATIEAELNAKGWTLAW